MLHHHVCTGDGIVAKGFQRIYIRFETGQYPKKKVEEIVDARLSDIFEIIQTHLKSIKRDGLLPAGIIITGGGGMLGHIDEFSKSALKLPSLVMHVEHIMNTRKGLDPSWLVASLLNCVETI